MSEHASDASDQRPMKVPRTSSNAQGREKDSNVINFVEFYCGVGGWSMALEQAFERIAATTSTDNSNSGIDNDLRESLKNKSLRCIAALDHSDLCTKVYKHNMRDGDADPSTKSIEKLSIKKVEKWNARIWAMSPPCQPHTRQHANQKEDLQDPRSKSFLHLCHLIETMDEATLPQLILVENVVGFETSNSCVRLRQVLSKRNYSVGHFHLTPTQVGIPNDRPRYYSVAVRLDASVSDGDLGKYTKLEKMSEGSESSDCIPYTCLEALGVVDTTQVASDTKESSLSTIADFLDKDGDINSKLKIPDKTLNSNAAWCFDIVTGSDQRSSCFTHAYGKFVRGTGSVYYFGSFNRSDGQPFRLVPPEEREFEQDWKKGLDLENGMRYFSGNEIARLMDYRAGFAFPNDVTMKQQWKLLGNSLNVRVASKMCELGLRLMLKKP